MRSICRRFIEAREISRASEKGYILVVFALMLIPLMAMAGFSVDVGAWYSESMSLQRASDAAALAGVIWMPDLTTATSVAKAAAAKNGYVDGQNNISITVTAVSSSDDELQVSITNSNVPRFFTKLFLHNETLGRTSKAVYRLPLPLGSPKNTFGTGDIFTGSNADNLWAAVSGYCAGRESGDLLLAHDDQTYFNSTYNCPGKTTSGDYDPAGYYYSVDVPSGASGTLGLWLFDPAFDGGRGDASLMSSPSVTTTFTLYGPGPNSTEVPTGGPVLKTQTFASGSTTYKNIWDNFYSGNLGSGRYFLEVSTTANEANSYGSNGFAIQALIGGGTPGNGSAGSGTGACSTISTALNYSTYCPQVHGVKNMSVYNNLSGVSQADFYLAQVDPSYAGKKLNIALFDPAEGASALEVLDPNGNLATFNWAVDCTVNPAPTGGCTGGPTTSLNVSGSGAQISSNLIGTGRYNDRTVNITVQLPTNYTATYGTNQWFKIRYLTSGSPTDRTTWSADIEGTPVHLLGD